MSTRYTDRLAEAGIKHSVGSRGDSYDTQFKLFPERRPGLTRATIGLVASALTCRPSRAFPVHRRTQRM